MSDCSTHAFDVPQRERDDDDDDVWLDKSVCDLHNTLIEAVEELLELSSSKAPGLALAVDYYAYELRLFGFDIPPTPFEEYGDGDDR